MIVHNCHAKGCYLSVPPKRLFCKRHWRMLSFKLRQAVWREYIPGQEVGKDPTPEYLKVMQEAIDFVASLEGR